MSCGQSVSVVDDLGVGLEAHVHEPVDRQHQEHEIERHHHGAAAQCVRSPGDGRRLRRGATAARGPTDRRTAVSLIRRRSRVGVDVGHDRVEHPADREDDEVVDERHGGRLAEVELAERELDEVDRQEGGRVAGPAAGEHERLGVDHERIHEAQQHRDQQHAPHLRQLDGAEHRPARGAVDARRLVVGVGDRLQAGIAEQRDEARPVPDVHDDDGDPGGERVAVVVVVDPEPVDA